MNIIKRKGCLLPIKTSDDFVVVHTRNHTHSHFQDYKGAVICMDLYFKRRVKPKSEYMREAVRRLRV